MDYKPDATIYKDFLERKQRALTSPDVSLPILQELIYEAEVLNMTASKAQLEKYRDHYCQDVKYGN